MFPAQGPVDDAEMSALRQRAEAKNILCQDLDAGDAKAGSIRCVQRATDPKARNVYRMFINRNHAPPLRFVTLIHELAHLFLGHLGADKHLGIPDRKRPDYRWRELEAESVAFIVCKRRGVSSSSERYLRNFVDQQTTVDDLDIYQVVRAAGRVESLLGLGLNTTFQQ